LAELIRALTVLSNYLAEFFPQAFDIVRSSDKVEQNLDTKV